MTDKIKHLIIKGNDVPLAGENIIEVSPDDMSRFVLDPLNHALEDTLIGAVVLSLDDYGFPSLNTKYYDFTVAHKGGYGYLVIKRK